MEKCQFEKDMFLLKNPTYYQFTYDRLLYKYRPVRINREIKDEGLFLRERKAVKRIVNKLNEKNTYKVQ